MGGGNLKGREELSKQNKSIVPYPECPSLDVLPLSSLSLLSCCSEGSVGLYNAPALKQLLFRLVTKILSYGDNRQTLNARM